jgi:hypothetical protein
MVVPEAGSVVGQALGHVGVMEHLIHTSVYVL